VEEVAEWEGEIGWLILLSISRGRLGCISGCDCTNSTEQCNVTRYNTLSCLSILLTKNIY
jgi:hypothetical protein